jgi:hypothetical protein
MIRRSCRQAFMELAFAPIIREQSAMWKNGFLLPALLQFRVLRLGLLEDGEVGVGVFPGVKESW